MKRLLPLRVFYFAIFAALGAYLPFFPRWLEARGVEGLSMGVVAGLSPAMGLIGPPVIGVLADALGLRGAILRVTCLGAGLSMAALAIGAIVAGAEGRPPSFALIFAAVLAYAVFRSPMVMLADVVTLERAPSAGTTYGAVRLWGSLGFLAAALGAGRALDPRAGAPLPTFIAALLLVGFLAAIPLPAKPPAPRLPVGREARALLAAPAFTRFLWISALAQMAHASYDLCFSLHLRDLGASDALTGLAWALGVVFEIALMACADRILARVAAPRLVALALLGAAARWALLAGVRSVPVLLALAPLHAVSFALWWVASLAYVKDRAPAHALATGQGLFSTAVAAGSVAGMLTWGALYRREGGVAVFAAAACVSLGASILAATWAPRTSAREPHGR